jgi:hypothetical protein
MTYYIALQEINTPTIYIEFSVYTIIICILSIFLMDIPNTSIFLLIKLLDVSKQVERVEGQFDQWRLIRSSALFPPGLCSSRIEEGFEERRSSLSYSLFSLMWDWMLSPGMNQIA